MSFFHKFRVDTIENILVNEKSNEVSFSDFIKDKVKDINDKDIKENKEYNRSKKLDKRDDRFSAFSIVIRIFFLLLGLLIFLYPFINEYFFAHDKVQEIADYQLQVEELTADKTESILSSAAEYNELLVDEQVDPQVLPLSLAERYPNELNPAKNSIMGYVEVPKINVYLPIFHGSDYVTLEKGAGHLEGTSLPVLGDTVHSVVLAHTGLPSAKLFSDLDKLELGDYFKITAMDQETWYEVDQITVIRPEDTDSFKLYDGRDYVTLMTCTPYGVNSHRLLVRGYPVLEPDSPQEFPLWLAVLDSYGISTSIGILLGLLGLLLEWLRHRRRGFKIMLHYDFPKDDVYYFRIGYYHRKRS